MDIPVSVIAASRSIGGFHKTAPDAVPTLAEYAEARSDRPGFPDASHPALSRLLRDMPVQRLTDEMCARTLLDELVDGAREDEQCG